MRRWAWWPSTASRAEARCAELEAELERREADAATQSLALGRPRPSDGPDEISLEEEAQLEIQKKLTGELSIAHGESVREIDRRNAVLDDEMEELRGCLQEQRKTLFDMNERCRHFQQELDKEHEKLAGARDTVAEGARAKELEQLHQSTRMMRKSIAALTRRSVVPGAGGLPQMPNGGAESLEAEIMLRDAEDLVSENKELTEQVRDLRQQLETIQETEEAAEVSGPDAGGSSSDDAYQAALIENLKAEVNLMRSEMLEAEAKLKRFKASVEEPQEGYWDKWFNTWRATVCCREERTVAFR